MVFSSNVFLFIFLPAVLALYYIVPRKYRNAALLVVSLVFYGWGEPVYLLLMLFTIALNYTAGLLISREKASGGSGRTALAVSVVLNLGLLFFFKYAVLFIRTFSQLTGIITAVPDIKLPIGISFYIFQSMSYTIDVYRGEVSPQRNPVKFGTYVSMFPQLIAGPIVRYRDIAQQLDSRRENLSQFSDGVCLFIIGLSKKVLLANQMGAMCTALMDSQGTLCAWFAMAAYTLQIYFDFSGYSDMAIGLGKLFGFDFLKNFDYPYISKSVTEFWRRWHISLSTWFREYVYIPLGGNRRGKVRQILNLLIVWMLTGFWHGASWNFLLWGLYYAVILICEKLFLGKALEKVPGIIRHIYLLLAVSFGWMLFYFTELNELFPFLARLFTGISTEESGINIILCYLPVFAVSVFACTPVVSDFVRNRGDSKAVLSCRMPVLMLLFLLCVAGIVTQSYNPFIYFRF